MIEAEYKTICLKCGIYQITHREAGYFDKRVGKPCAKCRKVTEHKFEQGRYLTECLACHNKMMRFEYEIYQDKNLDCYMYCNCCDERTIHKIGIPNNDAIIIMEEFDE